MDSEIWYYSYHETEKKEKKNYMEIWILVQVVLPWQKGSINVVSIDWVSPTTIIKLLYLVIKKQVNLVYLYENNAKNYLETT